MKPYPKSPEEIASMISEDITENCGLLTEDQLMEADPMSRRQFLKGTVGALGAIGAAAAGAGAAGAGAPTPPPAKPGTPPTTPAAPPKPEVAQPGIGVKVPTGHGEFIIHFKRGTQIRVNFIGQSRRNPSTYFAGIGKYGQGYVTGTKGGSAKRPPEIYRYTTAKGYGKWMFPHNISFNVKNINKVEQLKAFDVPFPEKPVHQDPRRLTYNPQVQQGLPLPDLGA